MALCKNTTQYQRNDRNLLVQRTEFSLISTNIHYKCTIHQKIIVTQLHSQINRYSMALYYDTNIHFWILIGYIRVYFGDTRDYLDRHRGQPRPAAKLLLLVKNVLGLKFSPRSFILALVIQNPCAPMLSTLIWISEIFKPFLIGVKL